MTGRKDKHGMSHSPTYSSWEAMIQRCLNTKYHRYKDYGGRGIGVCVQWRDFKNFLADMGIKPEGCTLERGNNNGNYEPGNCYWATPKEQALNRNSNKLLGYDGLVKTMLEWAEIKNIKYDTLKGRIRRGWSVKEALERPVAFKVENYEIK